MLSQLQKVHHQQQQLQPTDLNPSVARLKRTKEEALRRSAGAPKVIEGRKRGYYSDFDDEEALGENGGAYVGGGVGAPLFDPLCGVENQQRDFFLRRNMDSKGYLPISLLASFHRLQALTLEMSEVIGAREISDFDFTTL